MQYADLLLASVHDLSSSEPIVMVSLEVVVAVAGGGTAVAVGGGGVGGSGVGWADVPHAASRSSATSALTKRNARWAGPAWLAGDIRLCMCFTLASGLAKLRSHLSW